ncbi:MAG TPA: hypothetical protein VJ859_00370 [Allosphingosinicella sp.]|nr:hypothetical protein [Allosphingosinicella sp.]
MAQRIRFFAAGAAAVLLSGCGQYLGDYAVEGVRIVPELPLPFGREITPYGQYLQVNISSTTSLTAISDKVDGVYVHADFCPLRDSHRLIAFRPVGLGGEDLGLPSSAPQQRSDPDGRYHYRIFVVVAHPMPGVEYSTTAMERPRYDIRTAKRDLCLRLFAPGYNLIPSRSQTIRVSATAISAAVRSNAAQQRRAPEGAGR